MNRISSVAVAHGGLTVTVKEDPNVVQPGPLSGGETRTEQSSSDLVSFLRVGAEQDGVARREQSINIIVTGHDVERMLGDDARRNLQDEAADFFTDSHIMRFERVQDALARRGIGNVLAAGQLCAPSSATRSARPPSSSPSAPR